MPAAPEGSAIAARHRAGNSVFARDRGRSMRLALAALLGAVIFITDALTPPDITFAALYVLVILLAGTGTDGSRIWGWLAACVMGATACLFWETDVRRDIASDARFAIAVLTLICTAYLVARQSAAAATVWRQSRALDIAGSAIVMRDQSGQIELWNRAAQDLYGWSRREAVGRNADMLLATQLPEPPDSIIAQIQARGVWEGDVEQRRKDGTPITVSSRWTLHREPGSTALMIVEANIDANSQKAAEALRFSELRYRTIFDTLAVAICEHDFSLIRSMLNDARAAGVVDLRAHIEANPGFISAARGLVRLTDVNETALRMLEIPSKDEIQLHLDMFLPEEDATFAACLIAISEGAATYSCETKMRGALGGLVPVILAFSFPPGAGLKRVTSCMVDISGRLAMQATIDRSRAELDHALRAASLGELSASIAHEVNQPLSAIMSFAHASRRWLQRDPPNVPEAQVALSDVINATENAGQVVQRVRKLLGRAAPDRAPVAIDAIMVEAAKLVSDDAQRTGVTVSLNLGAPGILVEGDRVLLQQVMINLLLNAIQAMAPMESGTRSVTGHTALDGNTVRIRISDTGPGLADDAALRAFQPFFTTKARGMGLGLAICRSTIEAHDGTISIERNPEGRGALVAIDLPAFS